MPSRLQRIISRTSTLATVGSRRAVLEATHSSRGPVAFQLYVSPRAAEQPPVLADLAFPAAAEEPVLQAVEEGAKDGRAEG